MAEKSSIIYILRQTAGILQQYNGKFSMEGLSKSRQQYVVSTISAFIKIPYITNIIIEDLKIKPTDITRVINEFPISSVQDCLDYYQREDRSRRPQEPVEQAPSIPPELEALVAEYEDHLVEENKLDPTKIDTVAESVKRARDAMIIRKRLEAIRQNRAALSDHPDTFNNEEEKQYESLLVSIVNPKAKNYDALLDPANTVISESVDSYLAFYAQTNKLTGDKKAQLLKLATSIVDDTRYLALTEAIDISNEDDLITGISVALHVASDEQYTTPISKIYEELDANEKKYNDYNTKLAADQLRLSQIHSSVTNAKSKAEQEYFLRQASLIESDIARQTKSRDEITLTTKPFAESIESFLTDTTDPVIAAVKKPDGNPDLDFDRHTEEARALINDIHAKLSDQIHPHLPPPPDPLRLAPNLERDIRSELPQLGLNLSPSYKAREAAVLMSDPKTQSGDLSAQAILLFSQGLTTKEVDQVIAHAVAHQNDPNSALGLLYHYQPNVFGVLRQQINEIESAHINRIDSLIKAGHSSVSGLKELSKDSDTYNELLGLSKTLSPRQIYEYARKNSSSLVGELLLNNRKLFDLVNKEIKGIKKTTIAGQIAKPLNRITRSVNSVTSRIYNLTYTTSRFISPIVRFIFNPIGSINSYFGRRAGQYVLRRVITRIAGKEVGDLFLKEGFDAAVKKITKEAAKKIVTRVTAEAGIELTVDAAALASAPVTLGISIAIAIAVDLTFRAIGLVKKGINYISETLYGEEFNFKTAARDTAIAVGAGLGTAAGAFTGFIVAVGAASYVAVTSALATIVIASFVGYFFFITSFLAAPILSTLAQLEAAPAQQIASGDCIFPVHGHFPICQGPHGTFTHSKIEAVDFCGTHASEIHAIADGTVTWAGNLGDVYGNYAIINTTTSVGTFQVLYGHMSELGVSIGDHVTQDQVIGITGGSGFGQANYWSDHLHLEYRGNITYNQCPAGGQQVPEYCADFASCGSQYTD